jgi:hypothetical protein
VICAYRRVTFLAGLLSAFCAVSLAFGQDSLWRESDAVDLTRPIQSLLATDLVNAKQVGGVAGSGLTNCSAPLSSGYQLDGFFAGAEISFLQLDQSRHNNLPARLLELQTPTAPALGSIASGYNATPRLSLGYLSGVDNLGVRVRLWNYENADSASIPPVAAGAPDEAIRSLQATVFDLEVIRPCYTPFGTAILSGGYRMAYYTERASLQANAAELASASSKFLGNGLTGAADLRYPIFGSLSLIANPRFSLLLGNQSVSASGVVLPTNPLNNGFDARYIAETQLGASFERPLATGSWFLRGGYEVQYWSNFVPPIGKQTDPSWTLFHGAFFGAGLQR